MINPRGYRPIIVGDYRIIWTRCLSTEAVSHRVYFREAMDPMSEHPNLATAKAAVKRYQAADVRREQDRKRGKAAPMTSHLISLGVLGPLPN